MSVLYHCADCYLAFDSGYSHYLSGPNGSFTGETFLVCAHCGTQYRLQHARQAPSDRLDSQPGPITISPDGDAFAACVARSRERLAFLLDDDDPSNWTRTAILEVLFPDLLLEQYARWTTVAERYGPCKGPVVFGQRMDATLELETVGCAHCHGVGAIVEWTAEGKLCPRCHAPAISPVSAYTT
jgi:hypothetical protein